ncbi:MAG TPA: hypothetical protein VH601_17715 [Bryobacteraceae bacterium]|jgi:hypothetical protein
MHEIFPALDVDRIRDFPADLGAFDPESLVVRYSFTREEHNAALRGIPESDELPDHIKTVVHETTHLLHTTTTPFGLLIYRLRCQQTYLVADAIRTIRARGADIRFPLQKTFRSFPKNLAHEVEQRIQVWYGIELLILVMMGENEVWPAHILSNPYLKGITLAELFGRVQHYLAVHQSRQQDLSALEPEEADSRHTGVEGTLLAFDILSGGANTLGIVESAGTISEYFGNTKLNLVQFEAVIRNSRWASTTVPKSWLIQAFGRVRASSLAEFVLSYLVLCELALFAPILPEHRPLRKGGINTREILPFLRWYDLLHAASEILPMKSLADYERYTTAVCEKAGLIPPKDVVTASVESSPQMPSDPVERRYWKAQRVRSESPGAFMNYPFIIARLPMDFDFPVITYKDRTLFLKDKLTLHLFVLGYLTRALVRRMLLRSDLAVKMPYQPTEEETAFYTGELTKLLEDALGYRVPGVSLS